MINKPTHFSELAQRGAFSFPYSKWEDSSSPADIEMLGSFILVIFCLLSMIPMVNVKIISHSDSQKV